MSKVESYVQLQVSYVFVMQQQVSTAGFWNGKVQNVVIYACCILCFFCFRLLLFITSDLKLFFIFRLKLFSYIVQVKANFELFCTCYNMYDLMLYMLLLVFLHCSSYNMQNYFVHVITCTKSQLVHDIYITAFFFMDFVNTQKHNNM